MKNLKILAFVILSGGVVAQNTIMTAMPSAIPAGRVNTTNPPNLDWVVGDFKILEIGYGTMKLGTVGQKLLPESFEVGYSAEFQNQYVVEKGEVVTLVIREGQASQLFRK